MAYETVVATMFCDKWDTGSFGQSAYVYDGSGLVPTQPFMYHPAVCSEWREDFESTLF
jgi:hypothetical protein